MDEDVRAPQGSYAELVMGRDRLRRDLERARTEYDILKEQYDKVYDDRERLTAALEEIATDTLLSPGDIDRIARAALTKEEQL